MTIANPVTWTNLCAEFGLNPATAVFPQDFYGKGGAPSSGSLSFQDFVGRSGMTFTPAPGDYTQGAPFNSGASWGINSSAAVTWSYDAGGASVSGGGTSTSITFSVLKSQEAFITVTATWSGGSANWTVDLRGGNVTGGV